CFVLDHHQIDRTEWEIICSLRDLSVQPSFPYAVRAVNGEPFIMLKFDNGKDLGHLNFLDDPP
ncbi:MAG: hypothetical protein AB7F61_13905, partial [Desulfobulbus sp.]